MPTRIRLQRKGKKNRPYYHIVVADSRSPRDGKYIERLGAYDPNQNPAFVEIDHAKALAWLEQGAQPSDTCRAILSYRGILYRNHLNNGVKKGAMDQAEADRRFDAWLSEKDAKIESKRTGLGEAAVKAVADRIEAETKKAKEMAAALSAKLMAATAEAAEVVADAAAEVADAVADAVAPEAPATEAAPETPAAEGDAPAKEGEA